MSAYGTFRTSRHVRYPVAIGGKQTWRGQAKIDVNDPSRTSASFSCCSSEGGLSLHLGCSSKRILLHDYGRLRALYGAGSDLGINPRHLLT